MKTRILFKTLQAEFPELFSLVKKYLGNVLEAESDHHYILFRDIYDVEKDLKAYTIEFYTTSNKYEMTIFKDRLLLDYRMRKCYAGENNPRGGNLFESKFSEENFVLMLSKIIQRECVLLGGREIFN